MALNASVQQMIAAESAAIIEESCPFLMNINRDREKEFDKMPNGFKIGSTVTINVPGIGSVYDGATLRGGAADEGFAETTRSLTVSSHKHTQIVATAAEAVFKLDASDPRRKDYRDRVLKPQLSSLCAAIEADLLLQAVQSVPYLVGTAGTVPSSFKTYNEARAKMANALSPADPRWVAYSPDANVSLVDASKGLFTPTADIAKQFRDSYIGRSAAAEWIEAVNLPTITNGNKVASVTVSGASQTGSSLLVGGVASGDTFKKGQVFTIAGVKQVHPLTGTAYVPVQQFVITADATSAGTTVTLSIYPAITPAMPNKTVSASPADAAALTFVGAASTGYRQNLMWQRDAFTAAFVPPPIVAGTEGYNLSSNGLRLAVQTGGSITDLSSTTRVDIMYGFAAVRGVHACRITE